MIALCLIFPLLVEMAGTESSSISQEIGLISGNVGDTVVLRCFNAGDMGIMFSFYKQTFGNVPQLISTIYKYGGNATFYHEFKGNPRFSVEGGQGKNNLMITNVEPSDSGTYYCGSAYGYKVEFGQGVILIIKEMFQGDEIGLLAFLSDSGSRNMPVIHQPVSESVQPGDSVTLNCTIHTETCAGEHSVYWFRHGSGESHPGIIYTHGERSDQCEKSLEAGSPTQSCVYNLPKRNLSLSDSGTYYCAVASCGEILFGNGTKLDIEGESVDPLVFVYCLAVALAFAFILIILLACMIYKMKKTTCLQCSELVSQTRGPTISRSDAGSQDADSLHYVALPLSNKKNRSRRQRGNMEEETVVMYSGIRQ
uniref:Ig-like domain-containing protein n=1 Tax=Oncorhynchus tshawytscha TaxID=74940 RepID=A0A8C8BT51_ONCTS